MVDSLKRISMANNPDFQKRCLVFMLEKAQAVLAQESPDADELKLAEALWTNNSLDFQKISFLVLGNPSIGNCCDAKQEITDNDLNYVMFTETLAENKFNQIAKIFSKLGVI